LVAATVVVVCTVDVIGAAVSVSVVDTTLVFGIYVVVVVANTSGAPVEVTVTAGTELYELQ